MGNLADKTNYLNGTKNQIKNALIEKGLEVKEEDTFRSYANKILEIGKVEPTELEYIENNGELVIDLNYRHKSNTNIKTKFYFPSSNKTRYASLFGARNDTSANSAFGFFLRLDGSTFCYFRTGNEKKGTAIYDKEVQLNINGKTATYTDGSNTYTITTTGTLNAGVNNMLLFGLNTGYENEIAYDRNNVKGLKIYYFQIYEGTTLVHDYVPYRNQDGIIGLYDKITGIFRTNTHSFIAEPENK